MPNKLKNLICVSPFYSIFGYKPGFVFICITIVENNRQVVTSDYLKKADEIAIRAFYVENFPQIEQWIINNNGSSEDAQDLFQDGMLVMLNCLQDNTFNFSGSPSGYLFSIVRYKWIAQLKKNKKVIKIDSELHQLVSNMPNAEQIIVLKEKDEEQNYLLAAINFLKNECKNVLNLYYVDNKPMKEIAAILDYSEDFVRVKKHRCMSELRELIFDRQNNLSKK